MAMSGQSREKDIPAPGMIKKRTIKKNPDLLIVEKFKEVLADWKLEPDLFVLFRKIVLTYYEHAGRDLAWRHTNDPYHILVSEIMLQQTQVGRVNGKYPEFIDAFPTFAALAAAPFHEVLAKWQGLGYNRRALAIHQCAKEVMTAFGGELPQDVEILATLPGIGHATARSIAAFAFNMPVAFIETNIRRVFIHLFFGDSLSVTDREILPLVEQSLDTTNPRVWYWALMDYGSALKNAIPNLNRKSAHYMKQSKFVGSDREIRGIILKSFVQNPRQNLYTLVTNIPVEPQRIKRIIDNLVKEGFLFMDRETLAIRDR